MKLTFRAVGENIWSDPSTIAVTFEADISERMYEIFSEAAPEKNIKWQTIDFDKLKDAYMEDYDEIEEVEEFLISDAEDNMNAYCRYSDSEYLQELFTVSDVYKITICWPQCLTKPHSNK